ncbi:MAG: hypothetical protein EP343_27410 [Deltaproteobacteria bacterium]|nr:MAG: hypothetical protein EP343_27410 [Deltaproteobacteria bacterium]
MIQRCTEAPMYGQTLTPTTSSSDDSMASPSEDPGETEFIDYVPPKKWLALFKGMRKAYRNEMMQQVFDIVRSEEEACKIVQDTFVRFFQEGQTLPVESYKNWLLLVAKTKAIQLSRKGQVPYL